MAVQNEQLDRFHVRDNMRQAAQDIQGGRILQVRPDAERLCRGLVCFCSSPA
jgi:hypothetical protein